MLSSETNLKHSNENKCNHFDAQIHKQFNRKHLLNENRVNTNFK